MGEEVKPSETIIALRELWSKMVAIKHKDVEKFETEDAFVFHNIDKIAKKSDKSKERGKK